MFRNPIVGAGDTLIRNAIQSADYAAGVSGWRISRDGDAEFNDVLVRGEVEARNGNAFIRLDPSAPQLAWNPDDTAYIDGFLNFIDIAGNGVETVITGGRQAGQGAPSLHWLSNALANGTFQIQASETEIDGNVTVNGNVVVNGIGYRSTKVATADQGVTNTITLDDSNDLVHDVLSGATYIVSTTIFYTSPLGNDFDYAWSGPGGSSGKRGVLTADTSSAAGNVIVVNSRASGAFSTRFSCGGSGLTFRQVREEMCFTAGANGQLTFQFAERVAGVGTTALLLANSFSTIERVG